MKAKAGKRDSGAGVVGRQEVVTAVNKNDVDEGDVRGEIIIRRCELWKARASDGAKGRHTSARPWRLRASGQILGACGK